jgi:hypothetical protein
VQGGGATNLSPLVLGAGCGLPLSDLLRLALETVGLLASRPATKDAVEAGRAISRLIVEPGPDQELRIDAVKRLLLKMDTIMSSSLLFIPV